MIVQSIDDWLSNLHRRCWFFKKGVLHCLCLMRNPALLFWWMHFMGCAVLEAHVWLLWSAAPRENIAFSSALTTIPSLSPSFFFLFVFDGQTLCQPVLCFQGIRAHGSASLSSRRLLSECLFSPGRGCLVVVSPWCTVLDRTAGVFALRLDYSTCIQRLINELICFNCFLKITIHSSLSGSKDMFVPLQVMRPA